MLPPGPEIRRVVDLGCGTGRFTGLLADVYGTSVVGVEPSSRMLTGREPLAAARGTFLAATAEALPLATGAIDLVFLSLVYHHLGAKTAALAELRRVARAGAHVRVRPVTLVGEEPDVIVAARFLPRQRHPDSALRVRL